MNNQPQLSLCRRPTSNAKIVGPRIITSHCERIISKCFFWTVSALSFTLALSTSSAQTTNAPSDLGRLVVIGDSLSAGFQNFSLFDSNSVAGTPLGGQQHGFAELIAESAHGDLQLPLITAPGIPPMLALVDGQIQRGSSVGTRENPLAQTFNLSVPGFLLADALGREINPTNILNGTDTNAIDAMALDVLGLPSLLPQQTPCGVFPWFNGNVILSELACAVELRPSTVLVSVGNNDALQALIFGTAPTPAWKFRLDYSALLATLRFSGSRIVIGNIPDVTAIPFLTPVPVFTARCGFIPAGATDADFVVPNLTTPSFDICSSYAVRSAALIASAQAAVLSYNEIIRQEASEFSAIVVNIHGLFARISKSGYDTDGKHLTTNFLGGMFSLDGIHPTNTGYAILANEWIRTINRTLGTSLTKVNVDKIAATDPLVL